MRIVTWNVNGLRAALRKGFDDVIDEIQPDVLLLQEIRVKPEQLPAEWQQPAGWHVTWHPAEKPGYAGTAAWTRKPHRVLDRGLGDETDGVCPEGRVLRVSVEGIQAASIYLPSGSSSPERQASKDAFMPRFAKWCGPRKRAKTPVVVGGDLNIAIEDQDLYYAKSNQKQSGFLPHERQFMRNLVAGGWSDTTRDHYGDMAGPYTWWSNRGQARKLDRGWRIDYLLANPAATKRVAHAEVFRELSLAVSDHAPLCVDLA